MTACGLGYVVLGHLPTTASELRESYAVDTLPRLRITMARRAVDRPASRTERAPHNDHPSSGSECPLNRRIGDAHAFRVRQGSRRQCLVADRARPSSDANQVLAWSSCQCTVPAYL